MDFMQNLICKKCNKLYIENSSLKFFNSYIEIENNKLKQQIKLLEKQIIKSKKKDNITQTNDSISDDIEYYII